MKFIIDRTSSFYEEEIKKPCKNCVQEEITYKSGIKEKLWVIEVNSLEELMKLLRDVDEKIIIYECEGNNYIEIYDDYRE